MAEPKTSDPKHEPQDRLTTLPDPLLTDIISRLPITTAVTTSTLCHHFHHLWKSTTHFTLTTTTTTFPPFTTILNHLIPQLTTSILHHLTLNLSSPTDFPDHHLIDSSFHLIFNSIIVEKITIDVPCTFYEEVFWVPKCLMTSHSLISVELRGKVKFDMELSELVELPKLKRLLIDYLDDVPIWLGLLVKSCTSLEDLDLTISLDFVESEIAERVDFICPKLKCLRVALNSCNKVKRTLISVYAPVLERIVVKDCNSFYCFVSDPSGLVDACVDLRRSDMFDEESEDEMDGEEHDDDDVYLRRMCNFVLGMVSVSRLEIKVQSRTDVFSYLGCVDDGCSRMFRDLVRFEATLDGVRLSGWEGLLLSMQRFPNLKHLKVTMDGVVDPPTENYDWCPPHIVPDCLTSKLKTIQIWGLSGIQNDLRLAAFILNNARNLEELRVGVFIKGEYSKILGMECVFCQSLFKLPRISSACKVVFSGRGVTTSSNTFNIDQFKGKTCSNAW